MRPKHIDLLPKLAARFCILKRELERHLPDDEARWTVKRFAALTLSRLLWLVEDSGPHGTAILVLPQTSIIDGGRGYLEFRDGAVHATFHTFAVTATALESALLPLIDVAKTVRLPSEAQCSRALKHVVQRMQCEAQSKPSRWKEHDVTQNEWDFLSPWKAGKEDLSCIPRLHEEYLNRYTHQALPKAVVNSMWKRWTDMTGNLFWALVRRRRLLTEAFLRGGTAKTTLPSEFREAMRIGRRAGALHLRTFLWLSDPVRGEWRRQWFERYPFLLNLAEGGIGRQDDFSVDTSALLDAIDRNAKFAECLSHFISRTAIPAPALKLVARWTANRCLRIRAERKANGVARLTKRPWTIETLDVAQTASLTAQAEAPRLLSGTARTVVRRMLAYSTACQLQQHFTDEGNEDNARMLRDRHRLARSLMHAPVTNHFISHLVEELTHLDATVERCTRRWQPKARRSLFVHLGSQSMPYQTPSVQKPIDLVRRWHRIGSRLAEARRRAQQAMLQLQAEETPFTPPEIRWLSARWRTLPESLANVTALESPEALEEETKHMHHCIWGYTQRCIAIHTKVSHCYSITDAQGERATLEIYERLEASPEPYSLNALEGKDNTQPSDLALEGANALVALLNRGQAHYDPETADAARKQARINYEIGPTIERKQRKELEQVANAAELQCLAQAYPFLADVTESTLNQLSDLHRRCLT